MVVQHSSISVGHYLLDLAEGRRGTPARNAQSHNESTAKRAQQAYPIMRHHRESSSADRLAHVVAALTCGISRQDAVTGGHASPQAQRLNFAAEGDADPPSDDTAFAELYEAHKDSVLVIACADGPPVVRSQPTPTSTLRRVRPMSNPSSPTGMPPARRMMISVWTWNPPKKMSQIKRNASVSIVDRWL